jgi:hypothetical protein
MKNAYVICVAHPGTIAFPLKVIAAEDQQEAVKVALEVLKGSLGCSAELQQSSCSHPGCFATLGFNPQLYCYGLIDLLEQLKNYEQDLHKN